MSDKVKIEDLNLFYGSFQALKKVTLNVPEKQITAIIGPSGCGKSTLLRCLNRMNDGIDGVRITGRIEIDRENILDHHIVVENLRKKVGMVFQRPNPFPMSVYDNIAYAKPGAKKEEVIAAAVAANAHDFILKKPDGYDTDVGERGNNLSGGEKQMVSIARAILRNPRILILDEATSSVDVQTEKKIQDALEKLTKSRTTIAIAHRLSTLRNCNRVIVIKDGKIVEVGTHKELMDKKGLFHKLITMQREFSKQASKAKAV